MGASPWAAHHNEANQTAKSGNARHSAIALNAIAPTRGNSSRIAFEEMLLKSLMV